MFRLILTTLATLAALALIPASASAASVGISSTVLIPTPSELVAGQTQYASYAVTAGTAPAKITVEWYRIINPRLSADFDSNRVVIVPEKSLGAGMTGGDSWTVPAGAVAGHYGVLFRYYAQSTNTVGASSYNIPGNIEATANNSFYVEADVCPNIADAQPSLPNNHTLVNGNCMPDVCPNISGVQTERPQGMIMENGNCVTPAPAPVAPIDVCPNVSGIQPSVPDNHALVNGNCMPDVCPNIAGVQPSMPDNHALVNGNCRPDVCDNFEGIQTSPPAGHALVSGNCRPDVCANIEGVQTERPQGMIMENGNCVNPPVAPTPDPVIPQVATPTGTTGKPRLSITKKGSKKRVKQGQNVKFTIKVKNTGTAAAAKTRVCDFVPAGMVYVGHTRRAMFERGGRVCWTIKTIGKGKTVTVGTLTVKITKPKGKVVNRACIMRGMTAKVGKCAKAAVTVTARKPQPTGGVTG